MSNILKPAAMNYKAKTPPPEQSFWTRLYSAVTGSTSTAKEPVRVRLINGWQDVNIHRINIVVCNFLYEDDSRWTDIEKATGLRREHIFYGFSAFFSFLLLANNIAASLTLIGAIIIPTIYTLWALNEENAEEQRYWLRYWVIYGVFCTAEGLLLRIWPDAQSDYAKLILLALCFLPYASSSTVLFDTINRPFLKARQKFQQYNYQIVE